MTQLKAPNLAELTARFLTQPATESAHDGEVVPHEVLGGFQAAPLELWREALHALKMTAPTAPPEWAAFVLADQQLFAIPLAAGLYPQRLKQLRNLGTLACRPVAKITGYSDLKAWANRAAASQDAGLALVAAGLLAALGEQADAEIALKRVHAIEGATERYYNQLGACEWLAGRVDAAESAWQHAGQSLGAKFNLALLALVRNDATARTQFEVVAAQLPPQSGWSHLARIYALLSR